MSQDRILELELVLLKEVGKLARSHNDNICTIRLGATGGPGATDRSPTDILNNYNKIFIDIQIIIKELIKDMKSHDKFLGKRPWSGLRLAGLNWKCDSTMKSLDEISGLVLSIQELNQEITMVGNKIEELRVEEYASAVNRALNGDSDESEEDLRREQDQYNAEERLSYLQNLLKEQDQELFERIEGPPDKEGKPEKEGGLLGLFKDSMETAIKMIELAEAKGLKL